MLPTTEQPCTIINTYDSSKKKKNKYPRKTPRYIEHCEFIRFGNIFLNVLLKI